VTTPVDPDVDSGAVRAAMHGDADGAWSTLLKGFDEVLDLPSSGINGPFQLYTKNGKRHFLDGLRVIL
jgi:hypothetical protein